MKKSALYILFVLVLTLNIPAIAVTVNDLDSSLLRGDQCLDAMLSRYIWVKGKDEDWLGKSLSEKYAAAEKLYLKQVTDNNFQTLLNGPWDRALVPVLEAQRDTIFDALLAVDISGRLFRGASYDGVNILSLDSLQAYLREASPAKLPTIFESIALNYGAKLRSLDELIHPITTEDDYLKQAKNKVLFGAACAQISTPDTLKCVQATSDLLEEAAFNSNMILPKIWFEFINNSRLREGVRQISLIMTDRIQSKIPGHLFSDFTQGFSNAGFDKEAAQTSAWKLLALYGNGGPNTGYRLLAFALPDKTSRLMVSLSVVGAAISYIEFMQMISNNSHYAFPEQATGCYTPKPYHFWLSAYFAHWLTQRGYSPEIAQMATFIVAKGYQVNRDLNNAGSGLEKILTKEHDHPTNEVIRVDLTLAAAGSVYGSLVDRQKVKHFSLIDGFSHIKNHGSKTKALSTSWVEQMMMSDRMRLLNVWDTLFKPNEALYFFRALQDQP